MAVDNRTPTPGIVLRRRQRLLSRARHLSRPFNSALAGEFRRRHPLQRRMTTSFVIALAAHLDFASCDRSPRLR